MHIFHLLVNGPNASNMEITYGPFDSIAILNFKLKCYRYYMNIVFEYIFH